MFRLVLRVFCVAVVVVLSRCCSVGAIPFSDRECLPVLHGEERSWRCYEEVPREDMRGSRDVFFHGRGDTLYLLFDPTDTLQYVFVSNTGQRGVAWLRCALDSAERARAYEVQAETDMGLVVQRLPNDSDVRVYFNFDAATSPRCVDSLFVRRVKAATREEYCAFYYRERRRGEEALKRTGNFFYRRRFRDSFYPFFRELYVLCPAGNGGYGCYRVRR